MYQEGVVGASFADMEFEKDDTQEEVMVMDLEPLCRICARICNDYERASLLIVPGTSLAKRMQQYLNVQLDHKDSQLPRQICQVCFDAIDTWRSVRETFFETQDFYQLQISLRRQVDHVDESPEFPITIKDEPLENDVQLVTILDPSDILQLEDQTFDSNESLVYPSSSTTNLTSRLIPQKSRSAKTALNRKSADNPWSSRKKMSSIPKQLVCGNCNEGFESNALLEKHFHIYKGCQRHASDNLTCDLCKKACSNKQNLARHMKLIHINPKKVVNFQCEICNKGVENIRALCDHMQRDHPDRLDPSVSAVSSKVNNFTYTCGSCKISFESLEKYGSHIKTDHINGSILTCGVCNARFKRFDYLIKHEELHKLHPEKKISYPCTYCNKVYWAAKILQPHIKNVHQITKSDVDFLTNSLPRANCLAPGLCETYVCVLCNTNFQSIQEYGKHFPLKHEFYSHLTCGICFVKFRRLPLLLQHEQLHKVHPEREISFGCRHCDESFKEPRFLKRHISQLHAGEKASENGSMSAEQNNNFECGPCSEKFPDLAHYDLHNFVHKKVRCGLCYKLFENWLLVKKHVKSHHSFRIGERGIPEATKHKSHPKAVRGFKLRPPVKLKDLKCPICGKSFALSANLKVHIAIHSEERNFVCEICARSYKSHSTLIKHKNTHFAPKFACAICDQTFSYKCAMRKHIFAHIKYFPFKCEMCPKKFKGMSELKLHVSRVHAKHYLQCARCGRKFKDPQTLRKHMVLKCNVSLDEVPYTRDKQFRKVPKFLQPKPS